ncbi:MAG: hypothetical protein ACLUFN_02665 [Eubacterium sp.]
MTHCMIQKSTASSEDMKKINCYSRRELKIEELYIFTATLCTNDIDRDFEKFSVEALNQMAQLFLGKTCIEDHSMKSSNQKARIFDTYVERQEGIFTDDGEPLYCLKGRAYMLNNDDNKTLIDEIDAGIKKEVSVSCSMGSSICSICGRDRKTERCNHISGRKYGGKLCYSILSDAKDAYELSFVAVPAQKDAGVTKSFKAKERADMNDIMKTISNADSDVTITKSQAIELSSYIDDLKEDARLGEEYKKQLAKDVVKLFAINFPQMDTSVVSSVAAVMTTKELLGFKTGLQSSEKVIPQPQLISKAEKINKQSNSEFKI